MREAFGKLCWGFLFILFDFRLQGFDVLPDIVGYVLFAMGFQVLAERSEHFSRVKVFNFILLVLSIFQIYEAPREQNSGVYINPLGFMLGLVTIVLLLIVVYQLMMGIKEIAAGQQRHDLVEEASRKWSFFLLVQIASLLLFVIILIPMLFVVAVIGMLIAMIVLVVSLMRFMKKCGEQLY